MISDNGLARIVVIGVIVITLAVLAAGTLLRLNGQDDGSLVTVVAAGLGALAGFLTRGTGNTTNVIDTPNP